MLPLVMRSFRQQMVHFIQKALFGTAMQVLKIMELVILRRQVLS
jgi:hypothetical protein